MLNYIGIRDIIPSMETPFIPFILNTADIAKVTLKDTLIVGIDPSLSNTGVTVINSTGTLPLLLAVDVKRSLAACLGTVQLSSFSVTERVYNIIEILGVIYRYMKKYTNKFLIVLEGYSYGSTGHLAELGELSGSIKQFFFKEKEQLLTVPPSTLKKFAVGKGNASKEIIQYSFRKHFGIGKVSSDISDSYFLSLFGAYILGYKGQSSPLEDIRQEIIHTYIKED